MLRVLDIAILGLLMDRDHHGYEIRTQLRDRLGVSANVSFGSIYPALARLERHDCVEAVATHEPRISPLSTGSLSGERASLRSLRTSQGLGRRGRKVYRITERGREEFVALARRSRHVGRQQELFLAHGPGEVPDPKSPRWPARATPQ